MASIFLDLSKQQQEIETRAVEKKNATKWTTANIFFSPWIILLTSIDLTLRFKLFRNEDQKSLTICITTRNEVVEKALLQLINSIDDAMEHIEGEPKHAIEFNEYGSTLKTTVLKKESRGVLRLSEEKGKRGQVVLMDSIKIDDLEKKIDGKTYLARVTMLLRYGCVTNEGKKSVKINLTELNLKKELETEDMAELNKLIATTAQSFLHEEEITVE